MSSLRFGTPLLYRLTEGDAQKINRRRTDGASIAERLREQPASWPAGAQAHIGNDVEAGEQYPLIVTRRWFAEAQYQQGVSVINGQVLLDGNDAFWVTSVAEGDGFGQFVRA